MVGNHKQLIAHDAAATEISIALKDVEIRHMYIGGYAATFLGDERATEDVDVLVEEECQGLLLKIKGFAKTSDNRLSFSYRGLKVHIDTMKGLVPSSDPPVILSKPHHIDCMVIVPKDYPKRGVKTRFRIAHTSTLVLMKLLPWNTAFLATRQERKFREASDLADIRLILKWLEKNDCMIKFPRIDQKLRKIYLTALGNLYLNDNETRAMICNTVTPGQMTAALVLNGCSGHFEDD